MWGMFLIVAFVVKLFPLYCRVHSYPCLEAYLDRFEVCISLFCYGEIL